MGCTQSSSAAATTEKVPPSTTKAEPPVPQPHPVAAAKKEAAPADKQLSLKKLPNKEEIDGRITSIKETRTATFGGVSVRYAYLTQRGYYPDTPDKANQDAYAISTNFAQKDSNALFGVFDGHGEYGDQCSGFVRDQLPSLLSQAIAQMPHDPNPALTKAHTTCNRNMNKSRKVQNDWSGTTSCTMYLNGETGKIVVCNIGDSRIVIGSCEDDDEYDPETSELLATAISRDHTPWCRDERKRIEDRGGRVCTAEELANNGGKAIGESQSRRDVTAWKSMRGLGGEMELGQEIDESGQPPRIWSAHGDYPGLSATRTMGDKVISDEKCGVIAEPEIHTRELQPEDKVIFLASDGVWEFMTNDRVIEVCAKNKDPLEACRIIQEESKDLWMKNDIRTDDITMICIYIDKINQGGVPDQ